MYCTFILIFGYLLYFTKLKKSTKSENLKLYYFNIVTHYYIEITSTIGHYSKARLTFRYSIPNICISH